MSDTPGPVQNGQARTDIAVLRQMLMDCQERQRACVARREGISHELEGRVEAMERQLIRVQVYGTIALAVLTGVVGPVVTAVIVRLVGG